MGSRTGVQTSYLAIEAGEPSAILRKVLRVGSLLAAVLIYCLISLGGLVRNAGAGLSCPDWPLCFGHVVPPMNYQVFLEWFHRLIAGTVSTLLIILSALVFTNSDWRARLGKTCALALSLLMAQVVLGGLTVLGLLNPIWVSSHLAVGEAFFSTMLVFALAVGDLSRPDRPRGSEAARLRPWGYLAIALLYGQILLGGLVSSNYAGLACPDFPTCNGSWVPAFEGLVRFQFLHRVGAALATVALLRWVLLLRRSGWDRWTARVRAGAVALPALLALQLALGIGSVFLKLPLLMSVAHLAVATALLGTLLVMVYEIQRS